MNDHQEQSAGKGTLAGALLAIDSRMPSSSAEGREIAKDALRRDRRRVRILAGITIGLLLLTVLGIGFSVYFYYLKISPAMQKCRQDISGLEQQLAERRPQTSERDLLDRTASMTIGQGWALFTIQAITFWGIVAVLVVMLAAAVCTVLLVLATRRATLRQIQAGLLAISEQFDHLEQSLHGGHSTGGGQAAQGPAAR